MQLDTDSQLVVKNIVPGMEDDWIMLVSPESSLTTTPGVGGSHGNFGWGHIVTKVITGPGFCLDFTWCELKTAITIGKEPLEPVLNLHVQINNEAYCSSNDVQNFLMQEDACSLFVQSTHIANSYMLPGIHQQLNIFYTARFLTSLLEDLPEVEPLLQLLFANKATPINNRVITASRRMERLINDFGKHMKPGKKLQTSFCSHTAIQILKEFL